MQELPLRTPISVILAAAIFVIAFVILRNRRLRKQGRIERSEPVVQTTAAPASVVVPRPTDRDRIFVGLGKTKAFFQSALDRISGGEGAKFFDELEEAMLASDVGIGFAEKVIEELKSGFGVRLPTRPELKHAMQSALTSMLPEDRSFAPQHKPQIVMIVGVNGAGKTTTIAKLCARFRGEDKTVLVGAADTYRAAATAQLKTWVERTGAEGVFQPEGSDPSAVAFDSVQAAVARKIDVCIVDTAGRLHTKSNLMDELKKMKRVVQKAMAQNQLSETSLETWLVLDGTQGQNAINQAREFHQALTLTGLVVTKLDGSSKGGAVLAIAHELGVPVIYVGVGEAPEDLLPFKKENFVEAILDGV